MGSRVKLAVAIALGALAVTLHLHNLKRAPARTIDVLCDCIGATSAGATCRLATGQRVPHDAARELCALTRALR